MEAEPFSAGNVLTRMLGQTASLPIINSTLSFLGEQELEVIGEIGVAGEAAASGLFFRVAMARLLLARYLNRVDRGVFFVFYEDQQFLDIEQQTCNQLVHNLTPFLAQAYSHYQVIFRHFQQHTHFLTAQADFQILLKQLLLEPDLPMPKLKRETIGMFCETAFQEYLSMLRFPSEVMGQVWVQEPLAELRGRVEEELEELVGSHRFSSEGKEEVNRKIRDVRFCGYKINHQNWHAYIIEGFRMHNIVVLLLAFCSQNVYTCQQYVGAIADPFMRFTQFSLRSNIYRNIIISVEQKLSFLFRSYNQFYSACFQSSDLFPVLNFWRPALSIWVQYMSKFHQKNLLVYNYITAKLRQNNLRQFLIIKTEKIPSFFSDLKGFIEFQTFSQSRKDKAYEQNGNKIDFQSYFQNNYEMYETMAKDYVQYMVDISMNEYNVHWCGHSEHIIKQYRLFRPYFNNVVEQLMDLYKTIRTIINKSVPKQIQLNIFKQVVKEDIIFSEHRLFKPVIIKGLLVILNNLIKQQVQHMPGYAVFDQQGFAKHRITIDFQQRDGLLAYFASKNQIGADCPQQLSFHYNIQVQCTEPVFFKEMDEQYKKMQDVYYSDEGEIQEQVPR